MRLVFVQVLLALLLWAGTATGVVLAFDALEWEQTGACEQCILLPTLRSRFDR